MSIFAIFEKSMGYKWVKKLKSGCFEISEMNIPSDRVFYELSENPKIIVIKSTEQKIWPVKDVLCQVPCSFNRRYWRALVQTQVLVQSVRLHWHADAVLLVWGAIKSSFSAPCSGPVAARMCSGWERSLPGNNVVLVRTFLRENLSMCACVCGGVSGVWAGLCQMLLKFFLQ